MTEHLPARLFDEVQDADRPDSYADSLADALIERLRAEEGDSDPPGEGYRRLLREALSAASAAQAELRRKTNEIERLRKLSVTDETTGVLNQRGFAQALTRALARLDRGGESGLLLVIDIDSFKAINDTHGHQAGDLVLASVATLLSQRTRKTDTVARIGGDEFAVILGGADNLSGRAKAARLEADLAAMSVVWKEDRIPVRASLGVVAYGGADGVDDVLHRADLDMYAKKRMTAAASAEAANAGGADSRRLALLQAARHD